MAVGVGVDVHVAPRAQLWAYAVMAGFMVLYAVGWATGIIEAWLALSGLVVFAVITGYSLAQLRRQSRSGPMLRLDAVGLVVPGHPVVPWSDIAEVRVTLLRPSWLFWAARLAPERPFTVVAFVGREGVSMPSVVLAGQSRTRWNRWLAQRLYGTACVVMPGSTTVPLEELLDAVRELGAVPVTGRA